MTTANASSAPAVVLLLKEGEAQPKMDLGVVRIARRDFPEQRDGGHPVPEHQMVDRGAPTGQGDLLSKLGRHLRIRGGAGEERLERGIRLGQILLGLMSQAQEQVDGEGVGKAWSVGTQVARVVSQSEAWAAATHLVW